jgi:RHS repeat-associated protein
MKARYQWDPYGNSAGQTGTYAGRNPFRFSTKYWDDWFGLGYWGYRWYSPVLGRWISRDPVGHLAGPHLYRHCDNRPLCLVDGRGTDPMRCAPNCTEICSSDAVREIFRKAGSPDGILICVGCEDSCPCSDPNARWDTPGKVRERACVIQHEMEHQKQWVVFCGLCFSPPCEATQIKDWGECDAYAREVACLKKLRNNRSCDEECKRYLDIQIQTHIDVMKDMKCANVPN